MNMHTGAKVRGSDSLKQRIVIDGRMYEVEYQNAEGVDARSFPINAAIDAVDQAQSLVLPTPHPSTSGAMGDESKIFRTPIAGIVTKINVVIGQLIETGEVLIV